MGNDNNKSLLEERIDSKNNRFKRDSVNSAILLDSREEYMTASAAKKRREKIKNLTESNDQMAVMMKLMAKKIANLEVALDQISSLSDNNK